MSLGEALLLGLIQGVTEFLPISSSGHLVLAQSYLGLTDPKTVVVFDALLHLATTLAIILYFIKDLVRIALSLFEGPGARFLLYITLALVLTGAIGLLFRVQIEALFVRPQVVALGLLVTGTFLVLGDFLSRARRSLNPVVSAAIGMAQGLALVPGVSRSGMTIATGLLLGLRAEEALRFSFILAIPTITGATLLQIPDATQVPLSTAHYLAGTLTAFIGGLTSLWLLVRVVQKKRLRFFALYCFFLAVILLVLPAVK